MKKTILFTLVTILLFTEVSCQKAKPTIKLPAPTNIKEAISQGELILKDMLSEYPGLSIAVGIDDSIVWNEGFGYSDTSLKKMVDTSSQFSYYSLSKSITGIALIKLIASNQLDIEKSVRDYIPKLPASYQDMKVKHLIAHTSGIRNYKKGEWIKISQNDCQKPSDALDVFINDPLKSTPGESSAYTSFGYVLISNIIEVVSGQTYIDFIKTNVLEPLGIHNIDIDNSGSLVNEVNYYSKWNSKKVRGKEAPRVNNTCKFGAGGLVGTTQDFVKLQLKMLNYQVVDQLYTNQYYTSLKNNKEESLNYAFGIGDNISKSEQRYHGHSGSGMGANGVFFVYPKQKLVITILGNFESKLMNEKIGEITQLFLGLL